MAGDLPLILSTRSYGAEADSHSHAGHHQLILPLRGRLELEVGGRGGRVDGVTGAIITAGERHSFRAGGDNAFLVLDLPLGDAAGEDLEALWERAQREVFFLLDPALHHCREFLALELAHGDSALLAGSARLLLLALARRLLGEREPQPPVRLRRALAFLQAELHRPLSVAEVAEAACLSSGHLHHMFQRWLARTPMDYLHELRLERAQRLLADSELPIAAIAQSCGFADQSALTRALRRRHGITPAQYRRRCRAQSAPKNAQS
ncbi:MAG TPA: AraC family transcriptional regulator [Candidatus Competibacteraceae bacterium]|nr:AraC family transcriptional regulator [Candidatus Competibacteraceae bacterium]